MKDILMGDILIGRNNILTELRHSRFARVSLLFCWWFLFDKVVRKTGLHLDVVLMIAVLGVMLLNIIYIPVRLLGNKKIGRGFKTTFIIVADVIALHHFNTAEGFSISSIFENFLVGVVVSLVLAIVIVALIKNLKVHLRKDSYRCAGENFDKMEGHDFEYYCADVLRQRGFSGVEVTQGSGDYGIDIIACDSSGIKYGIQCKRYESNVGWHAVEEARAGAEYYSCDRAVVLTNNYFTKQAIEGAQKIHVELWDREWLTAGR